MFLKTLRKLIDEYDLSIHDIWRFGRQHFDDPFGNSNIKRVARLIRRLKGEIPRSTNDELTALTNVDYSVWLCGNKQQKRKLAKQIMEGVCSKE